MCWLRRSSNLLRGSPSIIRVWTCRKLHRPLTFTMFEAWTSHSLTLTLQWLRSSSRRIATTSQINRSPLSWEPVLSIPNLARWQGNISPESMMLLRIQSRETHSRLLKIFTQNWEASPFLNSWLKRSQSIPMRRQENMGTCPMKMLSFMKMSLARATIITQASLNGPLKKLLSARIQALTNCSGEEVLLESKIQLRMVGGLYLEVLKLSLIKSKRW